MALEVQRHVAMPCHLELYSQLVDTMRGDNYESSHHQGALTLVLGAPNRGLHDERLVPVQSSSTRRTLVPFQSWNIRQRFGACTSWNTRRTLGFRTGKSKSIENGHGFCGFVFYALFILLLCT